MTNARTREKVYVVCDRTTNGDAVLVIGSKEFDFGDDYHPAKNIAEAIKEALLSEREEGRNEGLKEAAEIVADSVIHHAAHGSAAAWDECTKDPYQLEKEILALIKKDK